MRDSTAADDLILVAGVWMVNQGPPVPDRAIPLAEQHVTV